MIKGEDFYNILYSLHRVSFNVDDVFELLSSVKEFEYFEYNQRVFLDKVLYFIKSNRSFKFSSYLKANFPNIKFNEVVFDSFDSFKQSFLDCLRDISYNSLRVEILRKVNVSGSIEDLKDLSLVLDNVESVDDREFDELNVDRVLSDYVSSSDFYKFHVFELDNVADGLLPGTVLTIAGWVAHGKSSFVYNMIYKNMRDGKDSVLVALEIPKEVVYLILLSRHIKYLNKVLIPYKKILKKDLSEEELKYLKEAERSFKSLPGSVIILSLSDVGVFSKQSIMSLYNLLDKKLNNFSAIYIDHVNLFKYVNLNVSGDFYIKMFTEVGNIFKNKRGSKILTVLVAQVNREGYKKAKRKGGVYDMTALSDFNELERSSAYVLFIYSDEFMVDSGEMKVDLKKNRFGKVTFEPLVVPYDPKFSVVGYDDSGGGGDTGFGKIDLDSMFNLEF